MTHTSRSEPVYFGDSKTPLFGWLHTPRVEHYRSAAVTICSPFGHEALSSHRAIRVLAERLCAAGIVALRFDYEGTGNSAGDTHCSEHTDAWRRNTQEAHRFLGQAAPGASRGMVGIRLGALVALDAACRTSELTSLVLIAPPRSGRHFLRELKALHAAAGFSQSTAPDAVEELFGFPLPSALRDYVESLELTNAKRLATREIFAIDRADFPIGGHLAEALQIQADRVEIVTLPGAAELLADPHDAQVPDAMVAQTVQWLSAQSSPATHPHSAPAMPPGASATEFPARMTLSEGGVVLEQACLLGNDARLFGVLTTPGAAAIETGQLLLVSSGANPTPGPNRLYVSLARQLATRGMRVLRLDVSGIGDSDAHPTEPEHAVYATHAPEDVDRAVRYLLSQSAVAVTAGGICSGGYHALKAANAGSPLAGLAIINPLTFSYVEGMPLSARPFAVIGEAQRYQASLRSIQAWRKLLTGRVAVRNVLRVYIERLRGRLRAAVREALRHSRWALSDDLGRELEELARRGTTVLFVFAADDPGPKLLKEFGGSAASRLERVGKLRIVTINGSDHTFTLLKHQEALSIALRQSLPINRSTPSTA